MAQWAAMAVSRPVCGRLATLDAERLVDDLWEATATAGPASGFRPTPPPHTLPLRDDRSAKRTLGVDLQSGYAKSS